MKSNDKEVGPTFPHQQKAHHEAHKFKFKKFEMILNDLSWCLLLSFIEIFDGLAWHLFIFFVGRFDGLAWHLFIFFI